MSRLELRIPPDIVWLVVAGLMWLIATWTPRLPFPPWLGIGAALTLAAAGVALIASARASLAKASTTWRPTTPDKTTSLVVSGVYRYTRNPMYLVMLLMLLGLAVALESTAAWLASGIFVLYINRFQIEPEERALTLTLGQDYLDYTLRVHRWI